MTATELAKIIINFFVQENYLEDEVEQTADWAQEGIEEVDMYELEIFLEEEHGLDMDVDDVLETETFVQIAEKVIEYNNIEA